MDTYTLFNQVTYHNSNRVSPKCELDALLGVQKQLDKLLQNYELMTPQHCKGLLKKQYAYFQYFTNDFGEIGHMRSPCNAVGLQRLS